ncbi:MAG: copper oxidase [Xanthomonadales bacterium]|nr:copper oxidase [Xanthomonadales bacterium]NIX13166.1 copper oxidase [Xanthomonadales bacterium]
MEVDETGMVMNANDSILPRDCSEVSRDHRFEVRAGSGHARPGHTFAYDTAELEVEPCSRVTVTFVNEDDVRHQWMVHGLPRYLYPGGMFHLEAAGGETRTGTFIVPSDEVTYLVHCDLAQHMEKGMKAQLKVGGGSGDLWSVPGISGDRRRSGTWPVSPASIVFPAVLTGMILVMILRAVLSRRR